MSPATPCLRVKLNAVGERGMQDGEAVVQFLALEDQMQSHLPIVTMLIQ